MRDRGRRRLGPRAEMTASASGNRRSERGYPLPPGVTSPQVRQHLEKILRSPVFVQSERMCRFLRFVVEETLRGRGDVLKEYTIGLEVFDRDSSYDPRTDPIVRVEARRLRSKLGRYYEADGRDDVLRVEFLKGTYAPRFATRTTEAAGETRPAGDTIAVLPFTNLSADPDNEYFSDGLTEELIHALTKVDGLRVAAWSSALQFKGPSRDVYEIGRRLKVGKVLEGSVRRSGERLRITVQLVDTETGHYLWSETYDRRMEDLFAIQDEISRSVVDLLRLRFLGRRSASLVRCTGKELEAYNLYLRGRYLWNKRTVEGLRKSLDCYHEALSGHPGCALAYAGLADSFVLLAHYGLESPAEFLPKARLAATRALEMDPALAEAHCSLGLIQSLYDWDWPAAERHYQHAIELSPGYATAHMWYGIDFLALLGRLDEAFAELDLARQLDPLSLIGRDTQCYILLFARRYEEAEAAYRRLIGDEPLYYRPYTTLGRVLTQMGRYAEAVEALTKGRSLGGDVPNILGALGQTYALAGNHEAAQRLLTELTRMARTQYVTCSCFALIHLGLRERQQALDWIERGCERRELTLGAMKMHPAYDDLRSEPRFAAILRRIGLDE